MKDHVTAEQQTLKTMLTLYCKGHHAAFSEQSLCPDCLELYVYAAARREHCRHQRKTSCGRCQTNCYAPARREQMRAVMKYSGPRMLFYHPILTIRHALSR